MNFETILSKYEAVVKTNVDKLDASNASELKAVLTHINKQAINHIVLDLSASKYCDSSGLSAILMANRICKDTNGQFVLCGVNDNVMKLIQIAQLDKVLSIAFDKEAALEYLRT
jgi:anti-sigma B factor antagonist